MISINKAVFEFNADDQAFAQNINRRWESYYQAVFERVVTEVMSSYDNPDETIIVENLPLNLGIIKEDVFDKDFPERLREEMSSWFRRMNQQAGETLQGKGIVRITVSENRLKMLCFFLLHGYFPDMAENAGISFLLKDVLNSFPDQFREFLEAYAHYDFLYRRLVFQFTDEELSEIVDKARPDESKFINLYIRVQIGSYQKNRATTVSAGDYRNAIWILVLAYVFTETGSRFNRKQLVLYTLKGLSARFNMGYIELTKALTGDIHKLERYTVQLPELLEILKEIRREIHHEIMMMDSEMLTYSIKEIAFSIRFGREKQISYLLSEVNLGIILSEPESARGLLGELSETEIHKLVTIVIPSESKFIISYARFLDNRRDRGALEGKAGNEFRLLKWEFIFQVIYKAPLSAFNRENFILSVVHKLGAHYNLSVQEVLIFLIRDEELYAAYSLTDVVPVLMKLRAHLSKTPPGIGDAGMEEDLSYQELLLVLGNPLTSGRFIRNQGDKQMNAVVKIILPQESNFVIAYASVLDKLPGKGRLEGKSGSDFRVLKWDFIFHYMIEIKKGLIQRKYFVFSVLQRLAAHYNQRVIDLLEYFSVQTDLFGDASEYVELSNILSELYRENISSVVRQERNYRMSDESARYWISSFWGITADKARGKDELDWFLFLLEHHAGQIRMLWKEGKLDAVLVFKTINGKPSLQKMWIEKIGDNRLLVVWQRWEKLYERLKKEISGSSVLHSITVYIQEWIVRLTHRDYLGLSEKEIDDFLIVRINSVFPVGVKSVINDLYNHNQPNVNQLIKRMNIHHNINENADFINEKISVDNAGIILYGIFFPRLFKILEYLENMEFIDDDKRLRAIFVLQYMLYGEEKEYDESRLAFNKILVGWSGENPVPRQLMLLQKEKDAVTEMLTQSTKGWDKLKDTSVKTIREAFLKRAGTLEMDSEQKRLIITVEDKPYDVLLDSVPWNYSIQRMRWLDFFIDVKWRKK